MSEFKTGFLDAYRADIEAMFELTEEIPLVHTPSVVIEGNFGTHSADVSVDGNPLATYEPESEEGKKAQLITSFGFEHLKTLSSIALMQLFGSEIKVAIPEATAQYTPEQEQVADRISSSTRSFAADADFKHAAFNFINTDSNEAIEVVDTTIVKGALRARRVDLSISDAYIKKALTISELPVSFAGATTLDIAQTITPIEDEVLREAAMLFAHHESPEDMTVLTALFAAEINNNDSADAAVDALLARYASSDKLDQLQSILERIREKAQAAKASSAFNLSNPEMSLPSATELRAYKTLLSNIRS